MKIPEPNRFSGRWGLAATVCLTPLAPGLSTAAPESTAPRAAPYISAVRQFADQALERGRDTYRMSKGPVYDSSDIYGQLR